MSDLARALLDELAGDPVALERLRELVGVAEISATSSKAPAFTPRTLAAELGRSERSVRAAIARGELQAVKRGRGWVISADAVATWAAAPTANWQTSANSRPRRRRAGAGPMSRALNREQP